MDGGPHAHACHPQCGGDHRTPDPAGPGVLEAREIGCLWNVGRDGGGFQTRPCFHTTASDRGLELARGWFRTLAATAAVWLAINIPYVLIDPAGFRFPYQFALGRQDVQGTIWAVVGLSGELAAVASLITLGAACLATAVAIWRGRITPESGCALALLAFLGTSKLWQPHYLLWALAALALTDVPVLSVRCLEVANLAYFFVLWRQLPPDSEALWLRPVGAVRLACLIWTAVAVVRSSRPDVKSGELGSSAF